MGLHPLVARPRPRCWTFDWKLSGSKKRTVKCLGWIIGNKHSRLEKHRTEVIDIITQQTTNINFYHCLLRMIRWDVGVDNQADKWGNDFASAGWQRLFASCSISRNVSLVANELGKTSLLRPRCTRLFGLAVWCYFTIFYSFITVTTITVKSSF